MATRRAPAPTSSRASLRAAPARPTREETLNSGEERFVEAMGLYFERVGVPRIGGRILGLLMVSEGPISLDRMAALLKVSRASISTNVRQFISAGLVQHFGVPGDRKHYYVFAQDAWQRHLEREAESLKVLGGLCRSALEATPASKPAATARLRETIDYFQFLESEITATFVRWRSRSSTDSRKQRSR